MLKKNILIMALLFCLVSCSSPEPVTSFQAQYNFSQLSHYSLYQRNSDFTDVQNLSDVMRNRIEIVLEQAMDKRGFGYKDFEQAEIVISYYLVGRSARELKSYNREVNYCQYCLTSLYGDNTKSSKSTKTQQNHAVPGSLIIDIVDLDKKRSIWRSSYPLGIKVEDNSNEVKNKIALAVDIMFSSLPK